MNDGMNIKIIFSYDGRQYFGIQKQKDKKTVQGEIEKALSTLFKTKTEITIAGRTDKGVSALKMCANFKTNYNIEPKKICYALNVLLPNDIRVLESEKVDNNFHARFDAKQKTYCYSVFENKFEIPIYPFETLVKSKLNFVNMKKAIKKLKGKHDFSSFVTNNKQYESCERTITKAYIQRKKIEGIIHYYFYFTGDGFMFNQVRTMVGTLILVGQNELKPKDIKKILMSKNRALAGKVMPSEGLVLLNVEY